MNPLDHSIAFYLFTMIFIATNMGHWMMLDFQNTVKTEYDYC